MRQHENQRIHRLGQPVERKILDTPWPRFHATCLKMGLIGEAIIKYSPAQIEELIGDSYMGLCLDFEHAVKAVMSHGVDYKQYVQGFMGLRPKVFHVSDGM